LTLGHYALHVTVTQTLVIVSNKPTDSRAIHVVLHCVHRCMLYSGFLRHTWQTGFRVVAFLLTDSRRILFQLLNEKFGWNGSCVENCKAQCWTLVVCCIVMMWFCS